MVFIKFIKKQHFWLIVPVLLLVMIGTWYMAATDQVNQFKAQSTKIDGYFSDMEGVSRSGEHPNEQYDQEMKKMILGRAKDVEEAWKTQYSKQIQTMQWSKQMKPRFLALVNKMRPIESVDPESEDPMSLYKLVEPWMLQSYQAFVIEKELSRLVENVGARWMLDKESITSATASSGGGAYGGAGGEGGGDGYGAGYGGGYGGASAGGGYGDEMMYDDEDFVPEVVTWSKDVQMQVVSSSFPWLHREPTVHELLYSQEDLWVLDSLLQAVKETNGDSRHKSQSVITDILSIQLGKAAKSPGFNGTLMRGQITPVESDEPEEGIDPMGDMGAMDPYANGGMGMMDDDLEDGEFAMVDPWAPLNERYVGDDYALLDADGVRSADGIMVAKRMPVRIKVKMDSRKLAHFLAACANAPLTYEVHQVRINATDAPAAGGMGMMAGGDGYGAAGGSGYGGDGYGGGAGGSADGYGGGYGAPAGGGGYGGGYGDGGFEDAAPAETYDREIEFFGIINIYNPVDKAKLGTEPEGDGTDASDEEATDPSEDEVALAN